MPNGDTVQIQMPDGRILTGPRANLPIALRMGAKLYSPGKSNAPAPTIGQKIDTGLGQGVFKSLGITPRDPNNPNTTTWGDIGSQTWHNLSEAAKKSWHASGPLAPLDMLASGIEGSASQLQEGGKDLYRGIRAGDTEKASRGFGEMLGSAGQILAGAEGEKVGAPRIAEDPASILDKAKATASRAAQSIVNEGPSKERMQLLQESDALHTKAKLATLEQSVKNDASNLMENVSKGVDQKIPEGSVDGSQVANQLKTDLKTYVRARSLRARLPTSLQKILDESGGTTGKATTMRLSQDEIKSVDAMYKSGLRGDDLKSSLSNLGYTPKQVDAMMQTVEGVEGVPKKWGFEQAKQLRTELGDELFTGGADRYPGAVRKAMFNAWHDLTKQLDGAANQAGLGEDWNRAKSKWQSYYQDFHGTYDRGKFNQSPIGRSLSGANAKDIMEPLSGKTSQQTRDILSRYKDFGTDPKDIQSDVRRFNRNEKIMRFASPSKWDILMGAYALYRPEYGIPMFIARYGAPRLAEFMASMRAKGMEGARAASAVTPER